MSLINCRSDQESLDLMQWLTLWQYSYLDEQYVAPHFRIFFELLALVDCVATQDVNLIALNTLPENGTVYQKVYEQSTS